MLLRPKIGSDEFEIFALREDQILDFPPPRRDIQISSPDVVYNSAGGAISEDFITHEPPKTGIPGVVGRVSRHDLFLQTHDPIYSIMPVKPDSKFDSRYGIKIEKGKAPTATPAKNFLDTFFDWLNKILGSR